VRPYLFFSVVISLIYKLYQNESAYKYLLIYDINLCFIDVDVKIIDFKIFIFPINNS